MTAELLADLAARAGEILARDPEVELLALETELVVRYGFTAAQVEAGAARAVSLARRARLEQAVAAEAARDEGRVVPIRSRKSEVRSQKGGAA